MATKEGQEEMERRVESELEKLVREIKLREREETKKPKSQAEK